MDKELFLNYGDIFKELDPFVKNVGLKILEMRKDNKLNVSTKKDFTDIVTNADKMSEQLIVEKIKELYPDHAIRGEEGANKKSDTEFEWIIDPIDGTIPYANNMDYFSISIGLAKNNETVFGILYFPAKDKMVYAIKGESTFINGQRLEFKGGVKKLKDSFVGFDFSAGANRDQEIEKYFKPLTERVRYVTMLGCFTAMVLLILENKLDIFVHPGATSYDVAASSLILKESGYCVSGIKKDNIDLKSNKISFIVAKNKKLLEELNGLF